MSNILALKHDGTVTEWDVAGDSVSTLETTPFSRSLADYSNSTTTMMARTSENNLYFMASRNNGEPIRILKYNPKTYKFHTVYTSTGTFLIGNTFLLGTNEYIVWQENVSGTCKYFYTPDEFKTIFGGFNAHNGQPINDVYLYKGVLWQHTDSELYKATLGSTLTSLGLFSAKGQFLEWNGKLFWGVIKDARLRVYDLTSGSAVQIYEQVSGSGSFVQCKAAIWGDETDGKIYICGFTESNFAKLGAVSTDSSGTAFTDLNSILDNLTTSFGVARFHSIYDPTLSSKVDAIFQNTTGPQTVFLKWNSTSKKWDVSVSPSGSLYMGFLPFNKVGSFVGLKDAGLSSSGSRQMYDLKIFSSDGSNVNVAPKFDVLNIPPYESMTVDETISSLSSVLPDVVIGSDSNKFNDDFAADRLSNQEGWEQISASANVLATIAAGKWVWSNTGAGIEQFVRRFILSGDFRISLSHSNLSVALAAAGKRIRWGIRVRKLNDDASPDKLYYSDHNFVEISIEKNDTGNVYKAIHRAGGVSSTSSTPSASASSSPSLWIKRVSGAFSTAYGASETLLNPGSTLTDTGDCMLEFFVDDDGTGLSESIQLDDLHLYAGFGSLFFTGGRVQRINWNFGANGILSNTGNILVRMQTQ